MADDSAQATAAAARARARAVERGEATATSDVMIAFPNDAPVAEPSLPPLPSQQQEPLHEELRTADHDASTPAPVDEKDVAVLETIASNWPHGGDDVVVVQESSDTDRPDSDVVLLERNANGHSDGEYDGVVVAAPAIQTAHEVVSLIVSRPEATPETTAEANDVDTAAAAHAVDADTAAAYAADTANDVADAAASAAVAEQEGTRRGLEDELQCVLCHDGLFKPVTATCGHSFCRVCLLDSCLSRAIAETQCPICRADIMSHFSEITPIVFNVNVTLWNLIQLLVPVDQRKDNQHEEEEYALKLDQLAAKWKIHTLRSSADRFHSSGIINVDFDDDDEDDEDYIEGEENDDDEFFDGDGWDGDWGDGEDDEDMIISEGDGADFSRTARRRRQRQRQRRREQLRQRNRYPELKVENTVDGRLRVARNVILDTDDANEDGLEHMRVGLALVDFPSIFELYNEHQECSLAVLKMEEDEEMDTGFPFFMSEGGDDDALIISDFYNEVTLKVFDDGGNNVMERTRAARQGIVDFPELRLDVPAGLYTFHFSDDLYGTYLTVKTELRELNEASDAPLQEDDYYGYVLDEAAENDRSRGRQRHRQRTASDEEDAELEDEDEDSDDSFIVNDDREGCVGEATGAFSDEDGDGGDDGREVYSDNEDAAEAAAQRQLARREQLYRQRAARDDVGEWNADDDEETEHVYDMTGSDGSENDSSSRVIELVSQDTDAYDHEVVDDDDDEPNSDSLPQQQQQRVSFRRRIQSNRVVLDSDDDDACDDEGRTEAENASKSDEANDAGVLESTADTDEGVKYEAQHDEGEEETKEADETGNDEPTQDPASSEFEARSPADAANEKDTDDEAASDKHEAQSNDDDEQGSDDDQVLRRPSSKRRAGNVMPSDEDDDNDERDIRPAKKLKVAPTRRVTSDDDELEVHEEEVEEDDETKFERIHPFYDEERDERHEAEDAFDDEDDEDDEEQDDDELETGYREYGDEPEETLSEDDNDRFENEEDEENGDEYGDDDCGGDDGDGWD